jgi:hypothetical protein
MHGKLRLTTVRFCLLVCSHTMSLTVTRASTTAETKGESKDAGTTIRDKR